MLIVYFLPAGIIGTLRQRTARGERVEARRRTEREGRALVDTARPRAGRFTPDRS